jgi:geranylgeranyl pyrophosphate synthase
VPPAAPDPRLVAHARRVERRLPELLPPADERPEEVHRALGYAATGGGKRVRPVLALATAEMLGAAPEGAVVDVACAVELVHAASLVLDDLPAMDGAQLRRGRPAVHRAFGEDVAILAAFALLNRAFALVAEAASRLPLRRHAPADLIHQLAEAVGTRGLIGGQALDLRSTPEEVDLERLEYIHSHKTGALFLAAAELGAMAADARRRDLDAVARYAKNLGLAFQIEDDLLDALASPAETGKDAKQDLGKATFVGLLGVDGARALADELLAFAIASLTPFGAKADPLRALAEQVAAPGRRA